MSTSISLRFRFPAFFFTGDKSELPEVFANVNLGGKKLTKYQVFAAQWNRYKVQLSQEKYSNEILERTISAMNPSQMHARGSK